MSPEAFVAELWQQRAVAILRTDNQQRAAGAMIAAIDGGFRLVELTTSVPGVFELVADLSRRPGVTVGVGTVLTVAQANAAVAAGARFLVSPVTDTTIIKRAYELGVAVLPGTHTPTEMWTAHQAGAQLCKLFFAAAGGPAAIRAVRGPMPFLRIVPTHGVDRENAAAYLEAGAWGVGFVGSLFVPDELRDLAWSSIQERARGILSEVRRVARPDSPPKFPGPTG